MPAAVLRQDESVSVVEACADFLLSPHLFDGEKRVAEVWHAADVGEDNKDALAAGRVSDNRQVADTRRKGNLTVGGTKLFNPWSHVSKPIMVRCHATGAPGVWVDLEEHGKYAEVARYELVAARRRRGGLCRYREGTLELARRVCEIAAAGAPGYPLPIIGELWLQRGGLRVGKGGCERRHLRSCRRLRVDRIGGEKRHLRSRCHLWQVRIG